MRHRSAFALLAVVSAALSCNGRAVVKAPGAATMKTTAVKNEYLAGRLPGSWSLVTEDRNGGGGFDWMGLYQQSAGAGALMVHVNLLRSPQPAPNDKRATLDRFVGLRREMISRLSDGKAAQSGAAYSSSAELERARFGAADPRAHKGMLVEIRVDSTKVVALQYMESTSVGHESQMDARAQVVLDGVELQ
jgi:hypothetical protein